MLINYICSDFVLMQYRNGSQLDLFSWFFFTFVEWLQ